jgi:hypothetical protein
MGGYEFMKSRLEKNTGDVSVGSGSKYTAGALNKLGCGWVSGLIASLFCYPMDTVKRQLMLDGSAGFKAAYNGEITKCIRVLYGEGGVTAFYRGCFLNALKSAPVCALTLVCNDFMRKLLKVDTQ